MKKILGIIISTTLILTSFMPICLSANSVTLEAESAVSSGWTNTSNSDASGSGYIRANVDSYGTWSLNITESGMYKIKVYYATNSSGASITLDVGSSYSETSNLERTGSNTIATLTGKQLSNECELTEGDYRVKATVNGERIVLDYILFEKTGEIPTEPEPEPEPDIPADTQLKLSAGNGALGSNAVMNDTAAQLNKNGSISWTLGNDFEASKYNFEANFAVNNGERFIIYINDEKVYTTGYFANSTQWENLTHTIAEKIELKANDKITVEIDNVCVLLYYIKLIKIDENAEEIIPDGYVTVDEYGTVKIEAESYSKNLSDGTSSMKIDENGFVAYYTLNGVTPVLAYRVTVSETAKYRIITRVKTSHPQWASLTVNDESVARNLGDFPSVSADFEYGEMMLEKDKEYIFRFKNEGATGFLYMDYFMLKKADFPLMFLKAYAEAEALGEGKIKRGTDYFDMEFSDNVDSSTVSAENVKITGENGVIPSETQITDNIIRIKLKQTLDFDKNYTITVSQIKSTYGKTLNENVSLTVTTDNSSNDFGEDTASVTEKSISYENVTVKGTVVSGTGLKIKGRKVSLFAKDEKGNNLSLIDPTVLSGDNGEYIINAQIPSNAEYGKISFEVCSEYQTTPVTFDLPYYSESKETELLSSPGGFTENFFKTNQTILGLDVEEDIKALTDTNSFFNSFVSESYDTLELLKQDYKKTYIAFIINNATLTSDIEKAVSNEDYCEAFGFDIDMYNEIETNKDALLGELVAMETVSDVDALSQKAEALLEKNFLKEYGKSTLQSLTSNKSVYIGQSVELETGFSCEVTDIKEITMCFTASDTALFKNVTSDGEINISEDNATITYKKAHDKSKISKVGTVMFSAPLMPAGYTVSVSGNAVYEITAKSGKVYEVTDKLSDKNVSVTVLIAVSSLPAQSVTPSGGSSSGGVSSKPSVEPEPDDVTTEVKKYEFSDISSHEWAKESIYYLLSMGVLSESEDKLFNPDRNIKREEFLKMIVVTFGLLDKGAYASFTDVSSTQWYYPYVASAVKCGIITGNPDGSFGIGNEISRQDMAVIIDRVLKKLGYADSEVNSDTFSDYHEISDYAKSAVINMKNLGIINGMGDNTFVPRNPATRAQSAKMIYGLTKLTNR